MRGHGGNQGTLGKVSADHAPGQVEDRLLQGQ